MKLLILTQKADAEDPILGFFHNWIVEFSKHYEHVTVICLEKGKYQLPGNVTVLSLGKERGVSKFTYVLNFFRYVWRERHNYDRVFVHMNQIYVVLGGFLWKMLGKKISLWYTHRQTSLSLRIAEKFVDAIFTSSKESFRIPSKKVHTMGHGIKIEDFQCDKTHGIQNEEEKKVVKIISVGRITKIKNLDVLIQACEILKKQWSRKFQVIFIGSPTTPEDAGYFEELKSLVKRLHMESEVVFMGSVPNERMKDFYCTADLSVNLSPTGGTDKAVLESIASKTPAIVSNEAFRPLFVEYANACMFKERNVEDLAHKIMSFFENNQKETIVNNLRDRVARGFGLEKLVADIVTFTS